MIDALLPDALGVCDLMPVQFMGLCPAEYEIMLDSKIKLLRLQNPAIAPKEETHTQTAEDQMNMITIGNTMMGGSTL